MAKLYVWPETSERHIRAGREVTVSMDGGDDGGMSAGCGVSIAEARCFLVELGNAIERAEARKRNEETPVPSSRTSWCSACRGFGDVRQPDGTLSGCGTCGGVGRQTEVSA